MAFEWLTGPVSEEAPCGPDLERADDAEFIDYYFEAEGRLPEQYVKPGMRHKGEGSDDAVFDPKSIDHRKERQTIETLLKRSRDLRLLSLLARFEILAGRLPGFADALEGMVAILGKWPNDAHPLVTTSNTDRRMALDFLNTRATVIAPLQHLPLNGQPDATLRRYMAASGKVSPRSDEEDATAQQITDALADDSFKTAVSKSQADLTRAATALTTLARLGKTHPTKPMSVDFETVLTTISEMQALIRSARPELTVYEAATPIEDAPEQAPDAPQPAGDAPVAKAATVSDAQAAGDLSGQPAARVTLEAIEGYLRNAEPSSAALLLVVQARLLIGKPLIEALETLIPGDASKAVINFGPATGFSLPMERLRALSNEAALDQKAETGTQPAAPPVMKTRADVAANLRSVENWFRRNEPASPIPILLVRARSYLDKDFEALLAELIPLQQTEQS